MRELAIHGGEPVRTRPWPTWPVFDETDEQALIGILRSGLWGIDGKQVTRFAETFAAFQGSQFALCLTNGTAALEVALIACGVRVGDEVIVPAYTFVATASSVLSIGAVPIFADIDPETFELDAERVEEAVTRRTKAIIPVHMGGGPPDMDSIMAVARKHGLKVIEDAAQAHGTEWRGTPVGSIGHAGTFSFQSSKNLAAGEGGAITTNDAILYDRAWRMINLGRRPGGAWYEHPVLGSNFRMTEFQAGLLSNQIKRLPEQAARREENGTYLASRLGEGRGLTACKRDPRITRHAYHLFMMRYDASAFEGVPKARFIEAMTAEGIPFAPGYSKPLYREEAFRRDQRVLDVLNAHGGGIDYSKAVCPVAERVCSDQAVWLFQSALLGDREDMDDVVGALDKLRLRASDLRD